MKGMILAAGFGTRFRPITYEIPKPMIPVCNRPLIGWAVESLLSSGVNEIVVNLHHLPDAIEKYLGNAYRRRCSFIFSHEPEILGTGGGVRKVRAVLEGEDAFLLVNGDTIQQPPFDELLATLREHAALAALLLRRPPRDDRFTPVMFDGQQVTGFGRGTGEPLMFAGAHALSRTIFDRLPDRPFSGLTEDVYGPATESNRDRIAGVVYDGLWFDIGTARRYLAASQSMLGAMTTAKLDVPAGSAVRGDCLVGRGTEIRGEATTSVLGDECTVVAGATVSRSVVWTGVKVAEGARVSNSVVAQGVHVPHRAVLENVLICRRIEGAAYDDETILGETFAAKPIHSALPFRAELRGS